VPDPSAQLSTASARIWLAPNGVVHIQPLQNRMQGLSDAIENVSGVGIVAGGVRRPLLVHFQVAAAQTPECRAHYVSEEAAQIVCAVGIVTRSVLGRVIGNLMLGMNETKIPLRLFDDERSAESWLLERFGAKQTVALRPSKRPAP